jgi:NitT/TauT family transport system substrate-binding protein
MALLVDASCLEKIHSAKRMPRFHTGRSAQVDRRDAETDGTLRNFGRFEQWPDICTILFGADGEWIMISLACSSWSSTAMQWARLLELVFAMPKTSRCRARTALRSVCGTSMIIALAVGGGAGAKAADQLTLRLDWVTSATHMPFYLAIQRGWFKAADLDIAMEDGTGSTITVQLVGAGRFDIGHADLSPMAIARGKGVPVISVAGIVRGGGGGFIVPNTTVIKTIDDFVGKEILYTAGSLEGPFIEPLFKAHGISLDRLNLLNLDAASKVPSYVAGRGDILVSTIPPTLPQAAGKRDSYGIPFATYGLNLPSFGLIASKDSLAAKGPAIRRFVSVVLGAWTYILASHDHMVEGEEAIFAQRPDTPLPKAVLLAQAEAYTKYFYTKATADEPMGIQSDVDWRLTIADMEAAKVVPAGTMPSDYYRNDYIDLAAVKKIGATP